MIPLGLDSKAAMDIAASSRETKRTSDGISIPMGGWDCAALLLPPTRWAGNMTALISVDHAG